MIILIYGEDEYRVYRKLEERKNDFLKKYPNEINWKAFDLNEPGEFDEFKNFAGSYSMFSEKKLAVISGAGQQKNFEKLKEFIEKCGIDSSPDVFIIAREGDLLQKSPILSFFKKKAKEINKLDKLSGVALYQWIKDEVKQNGNFIEDAATVRLAAFCQNDTWRLSGELQKLLAYSAGEKITDGDVLRVCGEVAAEQKFFNLMDKLLLGQKKEALEIFEKIIAKENPDFIFNSIVSQMRNLVKIKFGIYETEKYHPFYEQKMTKLAGFYDLERIKKIYKLLADIDIAVKTGKIFYKEGIENFIISLQ